MKIAGPGRVFFLAVLVCLVSSGVAQGTTTTAVELSNLQHDQTFLRAVVHHFQLHDRINAMLGSDVMGQLVQEVKSMPAQSPLSVYLDGISFQLRSNNDGFVYVDDISDRQTIMVVRLQDLVDGQLAEVQTYAASLTGEQQLGIHVNHRDESAPSHQALGQPMKLGIRSPHEPVIRNVASKMGIVTVGRSSGRLPNHPAMIERVSAPINAAELRAISFKRRYRRE